MSSELEMKVVEGSDRFEPGEVVSLELQSVLRELPGRRRVHKATLTHGETVLLKHDLHPKKGAKDAQREWRWLQTLDSAGLPVPEPLFLARITDDEWGVVTCFIEGARTLADSNEWTMEEVINLVRRVHEAGVLQTDLHLGNFLLGPDGKLWIIDASSHRKIGKEKQRIANWALLRANLPRDRVAQFDTAFQESVLNGDYDSVCRRTPEVQRRRLKRYRAKCLRTCTAFVREDDEHGLIVRQRSFDPEWLPDLMNQGEVDLKASYQVLKKASKCLVVRGDGWVLKTHWGTRGRARRSWIGGHALRLLGFQSPEPLAYWERRKNGRLVTDGLLMAIDKGEPLQEWVRGTHSPEKREWVAREIADFLDAMAELHWSHGDTKASNFHVGPEGDVRVIDLDSFTWEGPRWRHRVAKDRARFERNARKFPEGRDVFVRTH